jgi:outer membrane lipopolysaccharide assembly protein LptE/RlpB
MRDDIAQRILFRLQSVNVGDVDDDPENGDDLEQNHG